MYHSFAQLQSFGQRFTQLLLLISTDFETGHRQFNRVFLESVNARKALRGQEIAIHPEVCVAARSGPIRQLGVHTFSVHHQRRQQTNVLAFEIFHELRGNAVWRLWRYCGVVVHAMLRAEFDVQKSEEVPHLRCCTHRTFSSPA